MSEKGWSQLWLDYESKISKNDGETADKVSVAVKGFDADNRVIKSAERELKKALADLDITVVLEKDSDISKEGYTVKGCAELSQNDEYKETVGNSEVAVIVKASDENGALYGAFQLIRSKLTKEDVATINVSKAPSNPLRMMNHWDNMDGSIERGYSGRSFFYENDNIVINKRTVDYARFMASVGINGIVINNVNVKWAASDLITIRFFDKVKELSDIFEDYGIKLYLSLNFASPIELGGLEVCDPLDSGVIKWWENKIKEVYDHLPNLG